MWDQEWMAFVFFVSMISITFGFELGFVLRLAFPYADHFILTIHWSVAIFLLHNVIGSLWKLISVDSSIKGVVLPSMSVGTDPGHKFSSRYCAVCECFSPPRSYHCAQCRVCILKRTHHCLFARQCVGYKNFRYFYTLLLHVSIGCLYATCLNMKMVWPLLGGFTLRNFFAHMFPLMFWMFGALKFTHMLICMLSVIHICGFVFTLGLLAYHGSLMIYNQTVFERSRSIHVYDLHNPIDNIIDALGHRWYLVWLSPWISSKLPGNGLQFVTATDVKYQNRKNK